MKKALLNSKILLLTVVALSFILSKPVYASDDDDCGGQYGDPCVINEVFDIEKEVKFEDEDDDDYRSKITNVKKGQEIIFRIKVKNKTDADGVEDVEADNVKMKDIFPDDYLVKLSGDLTEEWDNFKPGETKTFYIKAKVKDSEYDKDSFENCTVNKAELTVDGDFEGSDTAIVCYRTSEVTELPETGPTGNLVMTILGLTSVTSGLGLKKIWA